MCSRHLRKCAGFDFCTEVKVTLTTGSSAVQAFLVPVDVDVE